jgi:DNA-binding SARP family transcriptional activator
MSNARPRLASGRARPLIRLFGPLTVEVEGRVLGPRDLGGTRPKRVLEILLSARGHAVPTDRLAELLWGHELPQSPSGSIQTFVSVLRRVLVSDPEWARELVVTETEAYRFATELVSLDLDRFDELLERSAREPTRLARASLEQALDLVRGEVVEDEPYATWALELRGSYQGRVLGARLEAADAALAELDYAPALAHAEAAAALDRFSERAHRTAMLALYALGRQHDALARYRTFRESLDDELGLEPTAETRALESSILRQEDPHTLLPRPIARTADAGPRSFRLLGRTAELDTLTRAVGLALHDGLALIQIEGESGLGKTRLLDELQGGLEGIRVGRAGCSELEQHLPYVPLATALREALADVELDARRLPALGHLLPELALGGPTPAFDEVEVLEALVALVSEHLPLALLLDDLEWADQRTLAALGYLQRRGGGLRVALVTTVGAEAAPDHPVRRLKPNTLVRLAPLSPGELAPLGIPELHASTGGNPRFVSEALANGSSAVPSQTLTEALLAQARAAGAWAYRVLVSASVLEQPFEPEPLAEMLAADVAELTEELERLCELRILRIDGFRFGFRYDLVRQVLLGSISPARLRLLHRQLGRLDAQPIPSHPGA